MFGRSKKAEVKEVKPEAPKMSVQEIKINLSMKKRALLQQNKKLEEQKAKLLEIASKYTTSTNNPAGIAARETLRECIVRIKQNSMMADQFDIMAAKHEIDQMTIGFVNDVKSIMGLFGTSDDLYEDSPEQQAIDLLDEIASKREESLYANGAGSMSNTGAEVSDAELDMEILQAQAANAPVAAAPTPAQPSGQATVNCSAQSDWANFEKQYS